MFHTSDIIKLNKEAVTLLVVLVFFKTQSMLFDGYQIEGVFSWFFNAICSGVSLTPHLVNNQVALTAFSSVILVANLAYTGSNIYIYVYFNTDTSDSFLFLTFFNQSYSMFNYWLLAVYQAEVTLYVFLTGQPMFITVFCAVNLAFALLFAVYYILFGNKSDLDFLTGDFMLRIDSNWETKLLVTRLLFSITFVFSLEEIINREVFLCIYLVLTLLSIYFFLSEMPYYYELINVFVFWLSCNQLIMVCLFFLYLKVSVNQQVIAFGLVFWVSYPICKHALQSWNRELVKQLPFYDIKTNQRISRYMIILSSLIFQKDVSKKDQILITGVIKQHEQTCQFEQCVCKKEELHEMHIPSKNYSSLKGKGKFNYDNKTYIIHLVKSIFELNLLVTNNKEPNIILMFAYFLHAYIGNNQHALYILNKLKKNTQLSIQQNISFYRILFRIHTHVRVNNQHIVPVEQSNKGVTVEFDIAVPMRFYQKVTEFKSAIIRATSFGLDFWEAILNNSTLSEIKENGLSFYQYHSEISDTFEEIKRIYSNYYEITNIYTLYKVFFFGESDKFTKLYENLHKYSNRENEIYDLSSSTVVVANLEDRTKTIIERITENINQIGFNPDDCIGQDVKLLMPPFYKRRHSKYISNFFSTGKNNLLNYERFLFSQHSEGFCFQIKAILKFFPIMNQNIFYTLLFKHIQVEYDFVVCTPSGKIEMISKNLMNRTISNKTFNQVEYYIHYICKEHFSKLEGISEGKSLFGESSMYSVLHFNHSSALSTIIEEDAKFGEGTKQESLEKIIEKQEIIAKELKQGSEAFICKAETIQLSSTESLKILKVYNKMKFNEIANFNEMNNLEKLLVDPEEIKIDREEPNNSAIKMLNNANKTELEPNIASISSASSQSSTQSIDYFRQYFNLKKRYRSKKTYTEMKTILIVNFVFLSAIFYLIFYNYIVNLTEIFSIFSSLEEEYIPGFSSLLEIVTIEKSIRSVEIIDKLGEVFSVVNRESLLTQLTTSFDNLLAIDKAKYFYDFAFSSTYVTFSELTLQFTLYSGGTLTTSYFDYLEFFYESIRRNIPLLLDKKPVDNAYLLSMTKDEFYEALYKVEVESLQVTKDNISAVNLRIEIYVIILIGVITVLGLYVYSNVIKFYRQQNRMIALLYNIDRGNVKEVIDNINQFKSSVMERDEEKEKIDQKANKKKKRVFKQRRSSIKLNDKFHVSQFFKVLFLICLTLAPFAVRLGISSYRRNSEDLLIFLERSNKDIFFYSMIFRGVHKCILGGGNELETKIRADIASFRANQEELNKMFFDLIDGIEGSRDILDYYSDNYCAFNECSRENELRNKGYLFVTERMVYMESDLLAKDNLAKANKTTEESITLVQSNKMDVISFIYNSLIDTGIYKLNELTIGLFDSFTKDYQQFELLFFIIFISWILINQFVCIYLLKNLLKSVNFELKNIFSLMPYVIVMTNGEIHDLLSK